MTNRKGGKNYKKGNKGRVRSLNPTGMVNHNTGNEFFGQVLKNLGGNRLLCKLDNGEEQQAIIPGKFRRRLWFRIGDYIHVITGDNSSEVCRKIESPIELEKAKRLINKFFGNGDGDMYDITEFTDADTTKEGEDIEINDI